MNSISRSFPAHCCSEVQSIHNNSSGCNNNYNKSTHNSEAYQFRSGSSMTSVHRVQSSSEIHSQSLNIEQLEEDLFQNIERIPNHSNTNPSTASVTSEDRQNCGELPRDVSVFSIPVLPNYSDLWVVPVSPPKYPDPPSYGAVVALDGDGFEATTSSIRAITRYDRNTLTTTSNYDDDDDDEDDELAVRKRDRTTLMACFVCWFCGFIFGGVALLAAAIGKFYLKKRNYGKAKIWKSVSYLLSSLGLLIGFIIVTLVLSAFSGSLLRHPTCRPYGCWD